MKYRSTSYQAVLYILLWKHHCTPLTRWTDLYFAGISHNCHITSYSVSLSFPSTLWNFHFSSFVSIKSRSSGPPRNFQFFSWFIPGKRRLYNLLYYQWERTRNLPGQISADPVLLQYLQLWQFTSFIIGIDPCIKLLFFFCSMNNLHAHSSWQTFLPPWYFR